MQFVQPLIYRQNLGENVPLRAGGEAKSPQVTAIERFLFNCWLILKLNPRD